MNGEKRSIYEFDNFRLDVGERRLSRDGKPVGLSSRAFDLLLVLVENNGHLLGKEEIYNRIWRGQIVEESNLTVQMSAIRRALGETRRRPKYIGTVIGSGYRFTADVREIDFHADGKLVIESESIERICFETVSEIADDDLSLNNKHDFKSIESDEPVSTAVSLAPPGRRKPALIFVAAAGVLAAFGLGAWFYRSDSQASVTSASEMRRPMTITHVTEGRQNGAPAISPDGKFIAFIENASTGAGTIYVQQTDTNTVLQLLEPDDRTFGCINFSPDGSLIYYVVSDKRERLRALYSLPVLGGTPKRIIGNFGQCFALSPDGKRTAFWRNDDESKQSSLIIGSLDDGGGEKELLECAFHEYSFGMGVAWSPDGGLLAVNADTEPGDLIENVTIFGVDAISGTMKPLAAEQFATIGKMTWTSDGRNLVFVGKHQGGEQELFLMDYPSGSVRQITNDLESYGNFGLGITADSSVLVADIWHRMSELWSLEVGADAGKAVRIKSGTTNGRFGIAPLPDGSIAYVGRAGSNLDLWTVKEDGSQAKALTTDSFAQKNVAASPDGRYLVFASGSAGESRIFRMNADDGSELTQLTFGTTSDSRPDVSPDGKWVVYAAWDGKHNTIWKVPMEGGSSVQLTDYQTNSPVFSPDGKTIACVRLSKGSDKLGNIDVISAEDGRSLQSFQVMPFSQNYQTIRWLPDGKAVVFINWQKSAFNLWKQSLSGEAPKQITNFPSGAIWNFAYSLDGKRIFLARGDTFVDVVLLKHFL